MMTREQFGFTLNNAVDHGTVDDADYKAIMAHDAALRQQLEEASETIERVQKLEESIRDVCGPELNVLSNMNIGFVEKAAKWYQRQLEEANDLGVKLVGRELDLLTQITALRTELAAVIKDKDQYLSELEYQESLAVQVTPLKQQLANRERDLREALLCKNWGEIYQWHVTRQRQLTDLQDKYDDLRNEMREEYPR